VKRLLLPLLLLALLACAGCTQTDAPSYSVDAEGVLSLPETDTAYHESVIEERGNVTLSRVVFENPGGDVYALLAAPAEPAAAIVFAPGAGVAAAAHTERAVRYADAGVAFLVLDIRGNGGETPGEAFDLGRDYARFREGEWPQYYRIVQDLTLAEAALSERFTVPVYAAGSSNGGRYAAVAAAIDPGFAGYFGISTSAFDLVGAEAGMTEDLSRFFASINPGTYIARIAPRPVWILHAPDDTQISYEEGLGLFNMAAEPKDFIAFNGTHGICEEADEKVIAEVLTFNAR
jgi:fermentation-respiration switch protein FrsA (DUF1100 family)